MLNCREVSFHQSCCEKCQNFENVIDEISTYMTGIPKDITEGVESSLCCYCSFFPSIACILHNCDDCGPQKVKVSIQQRNVAKLTETRNKFLVKQWENKSHTKESAAQTYLH